MKQLFGIFSLIFLSLALSACTTKTTPVVPTNQVSGGTNYSLADVSGHNLKSDCWSIIDGQVYDFTDYVESGQHPGGENVADCCGIDCSRVFGNIKKHSSSQTVDVLAQYYLGAEIK